MSTLQTILEQDQKDNLNKQAAAILCPMLQKEQYVGEVYSLGYDNALVQIHDYNRRQVGGIPSLSFLVATRINPEEKAIDFRREDTSIILLRVIDSAALPNSDEALRVRVQSAQQVSGEMDLHWDERDVMDPTTHHLLSYAGVTCRVLGTFYVEQDFQEVDDEIVPKLELCFGSDISNYYPNQGLKVYKPNADALKSIVNFRDVFHRQELHTQKEVKIGTIRYASTNRSFQGVADVEVAVAPADLLEQKSALFGMTRTGKSNTTKILAKSVFELRFASQKAMRVGQLIFDPNGEYANENAQDNNSALKNVWRVHNEGTSDDIATYGILSHPNDPNRNLMLLNFYDDNNLQIGKEIIDGVLAGDSAKFISNFRQVQFTDTAQAQGSGNTRYKRRVLAYRSLLKRAGFVPHNSLTPDTSRLFNSRLLESLENFKGDNETDYHSAATIFGSKNATWDQLGMAFTNLHSFMSTQDYKNFENWYINDRPEASGDPWADEDFKKILEMISRPNGARQIGAARNQHSEQTTVDYADQIYQHLVEGKLVVVDQSSGDPEVNDSSARRIMWKIFDGNRKLFREGKSAEEIPDILIFIEEAHNLLPASNEEDLRDIWVRTAKEGAKYHLGMIYITQEVSSIQKNILKNTANWFVGHLNNTDETRELRKFYDFADFEPSIRRNQDRGFLRIKTLSNPYIVPVQVDKFEMPESAKGC